MYKKIAFGALYTSNMHHGYTQDNRLSGILTQDNRLCDERAVCAPAFASTADARLKTLRR